MNRITEILNDCRAVTGDTALRFGALLRDVGRILAQPPEALRTAACRAEETARRSPASVERELIRAFQDPDGAGSRPPRQRRDPEPPPRSCARRAKSLMSASPNPPVSLAATTSPRSPPPPWTIPDRGAVRRRCTRSAPRRDRRSRRRSRKLVEVRAPKAPPKSAHRHVRRPQHLSYGVTIVKPLWDTSRSWSAPLPHRASRPPAATMVTPQVGGVVSYDTYKPL